ncbi:MAG: hypothetical protein ACTSXY_09025 [Promethearchaeota archaeon]
MINNSNQTIRNVGNTKVRNNGNNSIGDINNNTTVKNIKATVGDVKAKATIGDVKAKATIGDINSNQSIVQETNPILENYQEIKPVQSVKIIHPDKIVTTIHAAPGIGASLYNELPVYTGPFSDNWNVQIKSLNYLLTQIRDFTVKKKSPLTFWHFDYTDSEITTITDKDWKNPTSVHVFISKDELRGIRTKIMAIMVNHANRKGTTMDCFDQLIVDTSESGGDAVLITNINSDPGVHSTTLGFGSSGAGNFSQSGEEAFSGGSSTGISTNNGGPVSKPYIQGISLKILN